MGHQSLKTWLLSLLCISSSGKVLRPTLNQFVPKITCTRIIILNLVTLVLLFFGERFLLFSTNIPIILSYLILTALNLSSPVGFEDLLPSITFFSAVWKLGFIINELAQSLVTKLYLLPALTKSWLLPWEHILLWSSTMKLLPSTKRSRARRGFWCSFHYRFFCYISCYMHMLLWVLGNLAGSPCVLSNPVSTLRSMTSFR